MKLYYFRFCYHDPFEPHAYCGEIETEKIDGVYIEQNVPEFQLSVYGKRKIHPDLLGWLNIGNDTMWSTSNSLSQFLGRVRAKYEKWASRTRYNDDRFYYQKQINAIDKLISRGKIIVKTTANGQRYWDYDI